VDLVEVDLISTALAVAAILGVVLQYLQYRADRKEKIEQIGVLAKQLNALDGMMDAQGKVISALAESQREKTEVWKQEIERRKKKDEFKKNVEVWTQLRDLLQI
jgi:hypothetical protein